MAMKFVMRRDGKRRATVRVEYVIGREEMRDLVAFALVKDDAIGLDLADGTIDVSDVPELTRGRVEKMCRWTLQRAGHESYGYWADDIPDEIQDAIEQWVVEEIDRLFPELA